MAKVLSDIEIAQQTTLEPITTIAKKVGLTDDDLELYGKYKAKISFDAIKRLSKEKTASSYWLRPLRRRRPAKARP